MLFIYICIFSSFVCIYFRYITSCFGFPPTSITKKFYWQKSRAIVQLSSLFWVTFGDYFLLYSPCSQSVNSTHFVMLYTGHKMSLFRTSPASAFRGTTISIIFNWIDPFCVLHIFHWFPNMMPLSVACVSWLSAAWMVITWLMTELEDG